MIDKKMMEPDLPELKEITDDGAINLIDGIIRQAASDYVSALVRYNTDKGRGKKLSHRQEIINCERFFRRDMDTYTYCELDGERVIEALRERDRIRLKKQGIKMEVPKY